MAKQSDADRIATKVRALRAAAELSLDAAAARIGCTKSHLWEFEQGRSRNPTLKMLRGLADGYGISLAQLIDNDIATPRLHPLALKIAIQVDTALKKART